MMKNKIIKGLLFSLLLILLSSCLLLGCNLNKNSNADITASDNEHYGVYYEIFVRSFADGNGDGIGDFKGAVQKLDYLAGLGVEGIWLMPINPSPSYHGYDVSNYREINQDYGTLEDFKYFVDQAHRRDIKVIIDFVVNHTSVEHPWFQSALAGDEKYRDYYLWADPDTKTNARGEWGQQLWHRTGNEMYHAVFWEGMPDLNFDNPEVRNEIISTGKYWIEDIGIDGFRLDAAKHIYSDETKNQLWWQEFSTAMREANPNVFLVTEVWDEPTIVASYLDTGITSSFNFDLSEKILATVKYGTDAGVVESLVKTRDIYKEATDNQYLDSIFLANHDQERVMTQLDGDINKAKLAASILLTLPGNPFIYYGEEIGMSGQKPDEWIREPMVWNSGNQSLEQTTWEPNRYNQETLSVKEQLADQYSLLNHYKKMISVRKESEVLIKGEIRETEISENGLIIYERILDNQSLLVIHNITAEGKETKLVNAYADYDRFYYKTSEAANIKDNLVQLPPYSTAILQK